MQHVIRGEDGHKEEQISKEKDLQKLVERHTSDLFGAKFLGKQWGRREGGDYEIDTIGITEEGHPVVIEYKVAEDKTPFVQVLRYFDHLKKEPERFESLAKSLANREVDWSTIRGIIVAPYEERFSDCFRREGLDLQWYKYTLSSQNSVALEHCWSSDEGLVDRPSDREEPRDGRDGFLCELLARLREEIPEIRFESCPADKHLIHKVVPNCLLYSIEVLKKESRVMLDFNTLEPSLEPSYDARKLRYEFLNMENRIRPLYRRWEYRLWLQKPTRKATWGKIGCDGFPGWNKKERKHWPAIHRDMVASLQDLMVWLEPHLPEMRERCGSQ